MQIDIISFNYFYNAIELSVHSMPNVAGNNDNLNRTKHNVCGVHC